MYLFASRLKQIWLQPDDQTAMTCAEALMDEYEGQYPAAIHQRQTGNCRVFGACCARTERPFVGDGRGTAVIWAQQRPEWPFLSQRRMPAVL
nr:hypothetical protein [Bacillaceae bacterium]